MARQGIFQSTAHNSSRGLSAPENAVTLTVDQTAGGGCLHLITYVPWYNHTMSQEFLVERVQTGVRMEKRLLKVLKAFAEYKDMTLGDLLEGIVLHAFDGKVPFSEDSLHRIAELKKFYGLTLNSSGSHRLKEAADHHRTPIGKSRGKKSR